MKNKERSFWGNTKRFFEPIIKEPKDTLSSLVHMFTFNLTGILITLFVQNITLSLSLKDKELFYKILIIFGCLFFAQQTLILILNKLGWTALAQSIRKFLYKKYFPKLLKIDNNSYEKIGTGKAIAIIGKGTKMWGTLIESLTITGVSIFVGYSFAIFMISQVSLALVFVLILFSIGGLFLGRILNNQIIEIRNRRNEFDTLVTKGIVKILMSKFEVLQANKLSAELENIDGFEDNKTKCNKDFAIYLILFFLIPEVIVFVILVLFFLYFGNLYFEGKIELSLLVGISGSLIMMQKVLQEGIRLFKDFTANFAEVEKFWDFFDNTPQIQGYETGKTFEYKTGNIEIKNLSFAYTEGKNIFNNFNLEIAGGKVLALVGNSGSGKSTLVKLISGYIKGDSGKIIVDSQDLSEVSLKSFYQNIGYLTQEPSVFDGTILENLMYGTPPTSLCEVSPSVEGDKNGRDVWEKHLSNIISLAKCEFIYDLPKGIETEIGERGVRLSGGQRQRLAIAKIMLKDPKIIILDEPTSALDSFSEEQVSESLHNLFVGRTVIIIAHRLQTVKKADKILVLEAGKVVEEGTHDSLITQNGIYKKMLDLQSGF